MNDLALGVDFLKKFQKKANFTFLSATIRNEDGSLAFKPYIILSKGDHKIGVVGITTGNRMTWHAEYSQALKAANKERDEIRNQVDYLILLASMDNAQADQLKKDISGYDLIVRTHTNQFSRLLKTSQSGYYLETGKEGKYIQIFQIQSNDGTLNNLTDVSRDMQKLQSAKERLAGLKSDAGDKTLEEAYGDSKATMDFINRMRTQTTELEQKLNNIHNYIAYRYVVLGRNIQDNPKWQKAVENFAQASN